MSDSSQKVRVRFAPSPTGFLHVGGARTAIFNWLFARKNSGEFFLRIEDTDVERSGPEMVEAILQGIRWLNLDWDGEVVYQSQRLPTYRQYIQELLQTGKGYKCYCTKEILEQQRKQAEAEKRDYRYRYHRTCAGLSAEEIEENDRAGKPYVVRFRLPDGATTFIDQIYGEIKVEHEQLDDFILLRSDGYPTYHFAVVVDDHEMAITHVIRGEDHLSNTPKHVLLYQALGWKLPVFAHVPMILGSDKKRLSKRHGATAVGEYQRVGYLPETMLNFLTLLGWSSGDDRELFNRDELIQHFGLEGIAKKSAVFDEQKLEWMNGQYMMQLGDDELLERALPFMLQANLLQPNEIDNERLRLVEILGLLKPRLKRLSEAVEMSTYFFQDPQTYEGKAVRKHWKNPDLGEMFEALCDRLDGLRQFDIAGIETVIRDFAEEKQVGAGKIIQPMRIALTGVSFSPGMFEVMVLLGRETVIRRLQAAIKYLNENPVADLAAVSG